MQRCSLSSLLEDPLVSSCVKKELWCDMVKVRKGGKAKNRSARRSLPNFRKQKTYVGFDQSNQRKVTDVRHQPPVRYQNDVSI